MKINKSKNENKFYLILGLDETNSNCCKDKIDDNKSPYIDKEE
jgi:hypothetical protein